tara:strand:- start:374 stop:664 length:291 start_codon:yes stop_codon:yes gene_type:complete
MKKLLLPLVILFLIYSCSSNNDSEPEEPKEKVYTVEVGSKCSASGGVVNLYCVSEETKDDLFDRPLQQCYFSSFKTLSNETVSGYIRSAQLGSFCD